MYLPVAVFPLKIINKTPCAIALNFAASIGCLYEHPEIVSVVQDSVII